MTPDNTATVQFIRFLEKELKTTCRKENLKKIFEDVRGIIAKYSTDSYGNIIGLYISEFNLRYKPYIFQEIVKQITLQNLKISQSELSDISAIKNLKNLTKINFKDNQIKDISGIKNLKNLTEINFGFNQITDISPIQDLTKLIEITFTSNQITDISPIKNLTNLTEINFGSNQITDISVIKNLKNLTTIWFYGNLIKDISAIKDLKNLTKIRLCINKITDISVIKNLKNLTEISFDLNQITDISAVIDLENLTEININYNQISDILPIKDLKKLRRINLQKNPIKKISEWICDFSNMNIRWDEQTENYGFISFFDNPIENVPIEIIKQGKEAIRNYFAQLNQVDYLYEAKLILVGEERAGKSTLAKALCQTDFKINLHEQSTEGIAILRWDILQQHTDTPKDFRFNVWDFGGQEIYHTTHQFFLTKRSLYLFVSESRKDLRFDDFYYWLHIINSLAGDSPVLVVQNKCDQSHQLSDITEWKKLFPQIAGDLHKISCNTEHSDWENIHKLTLELLKQQIYNVLRHKKLAGIGDRLPASWVAVRRDIAELQTQNTPYISQTQYREICNKHGLDAQKADFLSDYFHDLGVFLHFRHDIQLRNTVFLDYKYVTKALYKTFDNKKIINNYGKFTDADLIEIWDTPEFAEKQAELLNLLKNREFKICFQHAAGYYLVPQLFSDKQPETEWRTDSDNLVFCYTYRFLPKGILSQVIVLLNRYIHNNTFWKSGVLFAYKNSRALATEDKVNKKISIRAEGSEKRDLLVLIGNAIEEINGTYTNLSVSEELSCNCAECAISEKPYFWKLETINKAMQKGKRTVECQTSFAEVEINQLLGNYIPAERFAEFSKHGGNIINIYGSHNIVLQDVKDSDIGINK